MASDVAPITLITGRPGMGKTSFLVSKLMEIEGTRPIYVMGIPDLKLEHIECPPIKDWTEARRDDPQNPDLEMHYFTFPPHSLVVIDESQRVYRPRASASKVPPHVAAFETIRHTGIEFYLLTQSPRLLDSNISELVGKHYAIGKRLLGRYIYEWPYVGSLDSKVSREEAVKRRFRPPARAFAKYKSATVHIQTKRGVHQAFYFLAAALLFLGYQGYQSFRIFDKNLNPQAAQVKPLPAKPQTTSAASAQSAAASLDADPFEPRQFYRPESAPAYDGVRQVVAMPSIAGCVMSRDKCVCYTHQATRLDAIPGPVCIETARNGRFDPYSQQSGPVPASPPPPATPPLQNPAA